MQLFLCAKDAEAELRSELSREFSGAEVQGAGPLLFQTDFPVVPGMPLPQLAFARQWLPDASVVRACSIREWAEVLCSASIDRLAADQPWRLHVEPHYSAQPVHRIGARAWHTVRDRHRLSASTGESALKTARSAIQRPNSDAGRHRCGLIRDLTLEQLQNRRRHLRRQLQERPGVFTPPDSLVQLLLTGPEVGLLSIACAPMPFEQRHLLSSFPKGDVPVAWDKAAPSRAFAKLVEAELRLGHSIRAGETCTDLGAAPGSWSYVAVTRGARVQAVDRSPLQCDLMAHPNIEFQTADAFRFVPRRPVDWLLCDIIAAADRTAALLINWLQNRWCRRFVVTLKMQQTTGADALEMLKQQLPMLTSEFYLSHLNANKKEVCAFGVAK